MKNNGLIVITAYIALIGIIIATVVYLGSNMGDTVTLHNYKEVQCNDIVRENNAYTGKSEPVCEITMQQEDDNIRIFKGE